MSQYAINPYMPWNMNPQAPRAALPPNVQSFIGYIQDGKIFQSGMDGPQVIGVTSKLHDDLQTQYDDIFARTQEYYDALVEAGVIKPEPTPEEIIRKQAEQLELAGQKLSQAEFLLNRSEETQALTLDRLADLAARIDKLSAAGGKHESVISTDQERGRRALALDADDGGGGPERAERLPGKPAGNNAGDSGAQLKAARPRKRDGTFAKRPVGQPR